MIGIGRSIQKGNEKMRRETSRGIDTCTWVYKRELPIGPLKRHQYNKGKLIARGALEALEAYNYSRARGMTQGEVCVYMDVRCQYVPRMFKHICQRIFSHSYKPKKL